MEALGGIAGGAGSGGPDLSPDDIQRISDECLADPEFLMRFKKAMGDQPIPDPATDPVGHREFIQRMQASLAEDSIKGKEGEIFEDAEGSWTFTLPVGVFVIKATDVSGKKKVFINICRSPAISEPVPMTEEEAEESQMMSKDLQFRVPISIGPPRVDKDKLGKPSIVYDIAVNPLTLDKCQQDPEFKRLVCAMCLYGLRQKHEPELNTDQYKQPNLKVKGTPVVQRVRVARGTGSRNAFNNEIQIGTGGGAASAGATAAPSAGGGAGARAPEIRLTPGLSDPLADPAAADEAAAASEDAAAAQKQTQSRRRLVEELDADGKSKELQPGEGLEAFYKSTKMAEEDEEEAAAAAAAAEPKEEVSVREVVDEETGAATKVVTKTVRRTEEDGREVSVGAEGAYDWGAHRSPELSEYWRARVEVPAVLVVTVSLPEVQHSVKECNVDVGTHAVRIAGVDDEDCADPYCVVKLRFPVDADDVLSARFSKKKRQLTLRLRVCLPDEHARRAALAASTRADEEDEAAAARGEAAAAEAAAEERAARAARQQAEEEEQQAFNKQLVEAASAMQAGQLPPELQKMVDEMSKEDATGLLPRLVDGRRRGDGVDPLLEKLPAEQLAALVAAVKEKLGLEVDKPKAKAPSKAEEEAAAKKKKKEEEEEEEEGDMGYGYDKVSKKLFDVALKNRFVFALDL